MSVEPTVFTQQIVPAPRGRLARRAACNRSDGPFPSRNALKRFGAQRHKLSNVPETGYQSVDHRRFGDARHLHGGAGHHGGERLTAAHCRQSFRYAGRSHLGADFVPGRQRHRAAAYRMAGELLWPAQHSAALGRRVHGVFVSVRHRAEPAAADHLPRLPGRHRRRPATALAGHPDGGFPAGEARQSHGILGAGHRGCAHARPGARRLDHRQL